MVRTGKVGLRARHESDVPVLHAELYEDVATRIRADGRVWTPVPVGPSSPYAIRPPSPDWAAFSVVELATDELLGEAVLWGIDHHHRSGHLGISLRPAHRGRGLAVEVIRALCYYGFAVRGLQRLQLETLTDNAAMIGTAVHCGFVHEGRTRGSTWVAGGFVDEVILGLLVDDWAGPG